GMAWLTAERVRRACDPAALLPGARSFIAVGIGYRPADEPRGAPAPAPAGGGRIARYARGRDYHDVLKRKLWALVRWLEERLGRPVAARVFVDDGPCPDRAVAQRAGLGFFGKHTNLLTRTHGSYVLLGSVLTDVPLPPDPPAIGDCGSCTLCLDACPTGALPAPYVVDSARCISYLTIEHRGPIPEALRPLVGDHLFGCDICQEVCPWNRLAAPSREPAFAAAAGAGAALDPATVLAWDEATYRTRLRGSPLKRAKWQGLRRNAVVVLANRGERAALAVAATDADPVVRAQARAALGTSGGEAEGASCALLAPSAGDGRKSSA
ncbi:MAG TPA: tRNA epoxyqueuosine(34) reductase QueG, partial [Chloroflexota bacterium]|nr:tRNA epoxyqueuosine(34) reductase QueG [Chloroflexota bacterium]